MAGPENLGTGINLRTSAVTSRFPSRVATKAFASGEFSTAARTTSSYWVVFGHTPSNVEWQTTPIRSANETIRHLPRETLAFGTIAFGFDQSYCQEFRRCSWGSMLRYIMDGT